MKPIFRLVGLLMLLALVACASGNCRRGNTPTPQTKGGTVSDQTKSTDSSEMATQDQRVLVYKYDGSKQCNMGEPVSVEKMAEQLKGIKIYSSKKQNDGLMHIQACGTATGDANVYEIAKKDVEQAKKRGFEVWTFE